MKVSVDGQCYEGHVVDLRSHEIDGGSLVAAIQHDPSNDGLSTPEVDCEPPSAVYRYAGYVHDGMGLRTQTALAAAARSRGATTSTDEAIDSLRERVTDFELDEPAIPSPPDPISDTAVSDLTETVAAYRGQIEAHETLTGEGTDELRTELQQAVARLAERATEQQAAIQTRERRRELARSFRRRLDERREIEDRLANREREAHETLVEQYSDAFANALAKLPWENPASPFDADPISSALAVLRVARTDTPVVLEADRFSTPAIAADYLGAPVVRC